MAAPSLTTQAMSESDKVKLLLVDDNRENLLALEAILEGPGQELVTANSGLEALRHLLVEDFAAILLDVRMPDMDGFETATLIRSRKRSRNTPILFLTGYKNEEHLFRGYDLGAVDFLFKPIVPEILQSKVAVFVELSRSSAMLKRQTEELQRTERRLRAVLEAAPEAMVIFDRKHRIQSVNSETVRLFGYSREQLVGSPIDLLSAEWPELESGDPREILCVTSDGRLFPAGVSLNPLETDEGGIIISVIRDITESKKAQDNARRHTLELEFQVAERTRELTLDIAERKRVEQSLRESEQRLRVAIEAAQLGLWSVDDSTMRISDRTRQIFGLERHVAELTLAEWKDLIHADDRISAAGDLERCCAGLAEYESEYRVAHDDGKVRWALSKGQSMHAEDGTPRRIVGVAQDITQRKLAEQADHHRQKLESLGVLAGGIAHDFNNLLTGVLGNASLLLECVAPNSFERPLLMDLMNAADRAAQLTQQMLAYSGRGQFVVRPIHLGRQVREITALIRASIPKYVEMQFQLDESVPPVEADESQVQQLVMNLVINAAEAIKPEGGMVKVRTRKEYFESSRTGFYPAEDLPAGNYVVLEIEDNGHGMDAETKARIFDPFFTTKFTGRGLGLAAALGIVRGHRGGIQVNSFPGVGTTFHVYLPVPRSTAAAELERPESGEFHGAGKILVIDDEQVVRSVAKGCLEKYGYEVLLAEDGPQGIDLARAQPEGISMVLLDMAMPVMSGERVLRELLEIRPDLPVVASSGYGEREAIEKFGSGLAGFLQKPYSARQLAAKVSAVCRAIA